MGAQTPTYMGMVIGEHVLDTDMEMNPTKAKKMTKGKEEIARITKGS